MSERPLSRALTFVAADLDRKGYPFAGAVRQAARRMAEVEKGDRSDNPCPQCGGEVERSSRGRPKVYCTDRCRDRARSREIPA